MIRFIMVIMMLFLLSGCDNDLIYPDKYERAKALCDEHGGIEKVYLSGIFIDQAYCKDGAIIKKPRRAKK